MTIRPETLAEARQQWQQSVELTSPLMPRGQRREAAYCPCCDRAGRIYRYTIGEGAARSLLWLVAQQRRRGMTGEFIHCNARAGMPEGAVDSRSLSILERHGLVTRPQVEPGAGRGQQRKGYWRATPRGVAFALGRCAIPLSVLAYENEESPRRDPRAREQYIEGAFANGAFDLEKVLGGDDYDDLRSEFEWPCAEGDDHE